MTRHENIWDSGDLVQVLKKGGVAVMPTDTIYGIVGRAESEPVVSRIYKIRKRDPQKPSIILIGGTGQLQKFSINLSKEQKEKIKEYWPASPTTSPNLGESLGGSSSVPVSIVLDCPDESLAYLHRGAKTLAFRLPHPEPLRTLLLKTGPLIAPSANTEKFPASVTIEDAKEYFGDAVDFYLDGGPKEGKASKIIKLDRDGTAVVLRK